MSALVAALYTLCLLGLTALGLFVFLKNPKARLHQSFALVALALIGWVASLFAFNLQTTPTVLLELGRFNFACIVLAVPLGLLFVCAAARLPSSKLTPWLGIETLLLTGLTLMTPLVDTQELIQKGVHVTVYGLLFPFYVLHTVLYLIAACYLAFRPPVILAPQNRNQLRLIGTGILATAIVALITNALLPYTFDNFRFIHVGTLSTILFLLAVGDAVFVHHLFSIHVIIRATFVLAGLVALALELYQAALSFLAHLLPFGSTAERDFAATALVLVINAFTQDTVRRWLEKAADRITKYLTARSRHTAHQQ